MAYLILNEKGPGKEAMNESWYEFNPGDEVTLGKIEKLLSGRNSTSSEVREHLAGLCERSFEDKAVAVRKATFTGWMHILRTWFTAGKEKAHGALRRSRSHRSHKRLPHGNHVSGYKGKLSFV
jgi:hypothetical protein